MSKSQTPPFALGTFSIAGSPPFPGLVLDERVVALHALASMGKQLSAPLHGTGSLVELLEDWNANLASLTKLADRLRNKPDSAPTVPVSALQVHAPLPQPRQIFCSGANYRKHVIDLIVDQAREPAVQGMNVEQRRVYATNLMDTRAREGTPYIFSKAWSSIAGPFDALPVPSNVEQPDWELELAVIIGKEAHHVSREDAHSVIAGYTIVNDITNRELVHRQDLKAIGSDWVMGKCLPGYSPMGPYLVPAAFVPNPQDVRITLLHNGKVMQDESTADMIFPIPRLIEYLTSRVKLYPGDVLLTGSPSGNGSHYGVYLKPGDVMEGRIAGLGAQRTACVAEHS